jgi:stage II sporulation protein AA (anti-sigma F factor antagonist)
MSEIQITFQDLTLGGKAAKLISFMGQLDETNVDHEAKQIYQVISEMAEPHLLLDFTNLEYMNSKSIGYVTDWFTQVSGKSGSVSIVGPKPNILDILKVVGITQIIKVYNSLEEAKAAFGGGTPVPPTAPAPTAPAAPAPTAPAAPQPPVAPSVPASTQMPPAA